MISETENKRGWSAAIIISGVLLWGLHFLPYLMPKARLWGINHLIFLPPVYTYIYLIAGLIIFASFFPPVRGWYWQLYIMIADGLFERRFRFKLLVLSIAALAVFWLLRVPTNLLGDGYTLIYNIGNDMPVVFKWSEVGSVKIIHFISQILPYSGLKLGEYSYAVVSVLSGAVTFSLLGLLTFEIVRENIARLFILILLLSAGWMALFFGYVENYPIIWPFITAYLYFSIRYLNDKGNLIAPTVLVLLALVMHLQILFFLISYPVLLFSRGPGRRFYLVRRRMIWLLAVVLAVGGTIVFLRRYSDSLAFRIFFVPLLARPGVPYYSLFSPSHLADMVNELVLLIPLAPMLVTLTWKFWRRIFIDKIDRFLAVFSLGGVLFVFAIDPKLGMGCDWDLFALSGLAPILLFARFFILASDNFRKLIPVVAALALILSAPFFAVTHSQQPSIDHFKWLLNLDVPRSRFGMTFFRQYYVDIGDQVQADSLHREIVHRFPIVVLGNQVSNLTEAGRFREALILADSMYRMDPYSVEPYNLRGWVYLNMGQYKKAIENLEQSLRLGRYDLRILCNLGHAYFRIGQYYQALDLYQRARYYSPDYLPTLDGLTNSFFMIQQYDSAIFYAQEAIRQDAEYAPGYEVAGVASYLKKDYREAETYLKLFVQMTSDDIRKSNAENLLEELKNIR